MHVHPCYSALHHILFIGKRASWQTLNKRKCFVVMITIALLWLWCFYRCLLSNTVRWPWIWPWVFNFWFCSLKIWKWVCKAFSHQIPNAFPPTIYYSCRNNIDSLQFFKRHKLHLLIQYLNHDSFCTINLSINQSPQCSNYLYCGIPWWMWLQG